MRKNRMVLVLICAVMVMMLATGCGKEKEAPVPVDLSSENRQDGEENMEENTGDNALEDIPNGNATAGKDKQSDMDDKDSAAGADDETAGNSQTQRDGKDSAAGADDEIAGNSQTQRDDKLEGDDTQAGQVPGTEELNCDVISIGQDSFTACKNVTYSNGDADIMVGVAPGYEEDDDLVTVYVNENCSYQYKTVRNGGVNPEDVSSREGSFGDLKNGMLCTVRGSWRDGSFYADSIVMSEFV